MTEFSEVKVEVKVEVKDPPPSPQRGRVSRQEASPRGNCPLKAEQLGSVSDGGPKGLEGVCK